MTKDGEQDSYPASLDSGASERLKLNLKKERLVKDMGLEPGNV